jgi:excinuclease UvrABC helicase subunit UvrB
MQAAAEALDFERAIKLRDAVKKLKVQAAGVLQRF